MEMIEVTEVPTALLTVQVLDILTGEDVDEYRELAFDAVRTPTREALVSAVALTIDGYATSTLSREADTLVCVSEEYGEKTVFALSGIRPSVRDEIFARVLPS